MSVHVGIFALWVHPHDNIHGYIPLSIMVLAGGVAVERCLVGVSHRIGLRVDTHTHTHKHSPQSMERESVEIGEAHSRP